MPFAQVKSDPWKKGQTRRRSTKLWPTEFWARLEDTGHGLMVAKGKLICRGLSFAAAEMIREMNGLLYGDESIIWRGNTKEPIHEQALDAAEEGAS